ncbi:hypothetical protein N185_16510 [Sinorhizobium sp. GW3]|nr:hypothetical protein N185_16510 [Sinorhizobium sp. GW3]
MNMISLLSRLAAASAFAMLAGGANSTAAQALNHTGLAEPKTETTIVYAGAAYSAADLKPVFEAFRKAHPNIIVDYQSVPFNDFNSVLATRLGRGDKSIDVFDVDMPRTSAYAARGWLGEVSEAFPDLAAAVDPGSLKAATVDGKLVAVPYQTSTNIMYYNKKLLSAADISFPPSDPGGRMTLETLADLARKAKDSGAKWGVVFDQIDRYYQLEPLAISAGGGEGGIGQGNLEPAVANDGWEKALGWYGQLFIDGLSPRGVQTSETPDLFASGQVAFYVGGPWWAPQFQKSSELDFGIAPFPAFAGRPAATPTGGWSLGLNPNSDKAAAALIFMRFMAIENGGFAQYMPSLAVPPSNLTGAEKFYASAALSDPRMAGAVALMKSELAKTSVQRLQTVGYVEFEDVMTRTISDIINGADPKSSLQAASDELDSVWDKFR